MKKLLSILLTFVMVFSFVGMTASAASNNESPETGKIVINSTTKHVNYTIYKMFDIATYDATKKIYSYTIAEGWDDFFATGGAGESYITKDGKYIYWSGSDDEARVAGFAKIALEYAQEYVQDNPNGMEYQVQEGTGSAIEFPGLELGYYLVDTTMGALCGLTTTNPTGSIVAKNGVPTIDKQVKEDSTSQWGKTNTDDIGKEIAFRSTISIHPGAQNYVLHDNMNGLFGLKNVTSVEFFDTSAGGSSTPLSVDTHYTVKTTETCGCSFEVIFTDAAHALFDVNDKVVVYYTGILNGDSVKVGNAEGNENKAWVSFGEPVDSANPYLSTPSSTITYTYGFDLIKTDQDNALLDGASFKIFDAATGGNEIKVVKVNDKNYRVAKDNEEIADKIVVTGGEIRVEGLDNGVYYLEEIDFPTGYNQLTSRQMFTIADNNLDAIFNGNVYSKGSGVHVINKTGAMLPETGSMGTTAFVAFGSIVALATGVLLVTKKRMSMIDD